MPIDRSNFPDIRADVPGSHHPSVMAKWEETLDADGSPGPVALTAAVSGLKAIYTAQAQALDVRKELADYVQGKPVMHGGNLKLRHGFEREYAAGVQRIKESVLRSFDGYHAQVLHTVDQLWVQIEKAVTDKKTTPAVQAEIRAHIKGLPEKQRVTFVTSQPLEIYAAVMAAPSCLSGLTDEQRQTITRQAQSRFAPRESAQNGAAFEVWEHMKAVREAFVAWADREMSEANTPAARAVAKVKGLGK